MNVFISWSGARSREVAIGLRGFLPNVLPGIRPWMSEEDIEVGSLWNRAVGTRLEQTDFGIICATPGAIDSKWVTFEAGALSKRVSDACVVPYLIGLAPADVAGPLSSFQMTRADRKGTLDLVKTLKSKLSSKTEQIVDAGSINERFDAFWPKLRKVFDSLDDHIDDAPPRPEREMISELLVTVRTLARTFEVSAALSELASWNVFSELEPTSNPEEAERRYRAQMRVVRYAPGVAMRFLRNTNGVAPSSEDETKRGFSGLSRELEWAEDQEALLAAYILVANKAGASHSDIECVVAAVAEPRLAANASQLVSTIAGPERGRAIATPRVNASASDSSVSRTVRARKKR